MSQSQSSYKACSPRLALALFTICYGLGGGFALFMALREISAQGSGLSEFAQQAALILLYLVGAYLLLLFVVLAPYRFRFEETSFRVFTWRGWRTFAWSQVSRAELSGYKGTVELVLFLGPVWRVSVPICSFHPAESLFNVIRSHVRVPIAASQAHLALVRNASSASQRDA